MGGFLSIKNGRTADHGGFGDIIDTENHGNALVSRVTAETISSGAKCRELYAEETCLAESDLKAEAETVFWKCRRELSKGTFTYNVRGWVGGEGPPKDDKVREAA